jgi:hypothetical protein
VAGKIVESLHVPRVAVLLPDGGFYRRAYALGYDGVPPTEFRESAATIERLRKEPEPARVYLDDEKSWVNTDLPQRSVRVWPRSHRNCFCHSLSKTSSSG